MKYFIQLIFSGLFTGSIMAQPQQLSRFVRQMDLFVIKSPVDLYINDLRKSAKQVFQAVSTGVQERIKGLFV
jgi:hypothetical protein